MSQSTTPQNPQDTDQNPQPQDHQPNQNRQSQTQSPAPRTTFLATSILWVRHILFYGAVILWTTLLLPLAMISLFLPKGGALVLGTLFCQGIRICIAVFLGITHRVTGMAHLPKNGYIVASKHQSAWETLIFPTILPYPSFVLKQELMRIPVAGAFLRKIDMIPVSRRSFKIQKSARTTRHSDTAHQNTQIEQDAPLVSQHMRAQLSDQNHNPKHDTPDPFFQKAYDLAHHQQRAIVIFPEGTRTAPGQSIRYRQGVVRLAQHVDLPIIPVALNSGLFWPRRRFLKKPGIIDVVFLPAIDPHMPPETLMARLKNDIETASSALLK